MSFILSLPATARWTVGLLLLTLLPCTAPAQTRLTIETQPGLVGTQINDIRWSGRFLWVVTETGLARLDPTRGSGLSGDDWVTYVNFPGMDQAGGGVSALDAQGDTVWIATLFDTFVQSQTPPERQTSAGLHFSLDAGATWSTVPNTAIFDTSRAGFAKGPTTPIDNACFGLSIDGPTVWATFFAGASVRTTDNGRSWQRILPDGATEIIYFAQETAADSLQLVADSLGRIDGDPIQIRTLRAQADSLIGQALLHRTFEVLAYNDTVWIGTANGIAASLDGGATWRTSRVRFDAAGQPLPGNPAGNWGLALARQIRPDGGSTIWAGTRTTGPGQRQAMNFSTDDGQTWTITGPRSAWDFAFDNQRVWAGTDAPNNDDGLLTSADGLTWEVVPVEDATTRENLRGTFIGVEFFDDVLWVGSESGLGRSADGGQNWQILKAPVRPLSIDGNEVVGQSGLIDTTVQTYAAPNPFDPSDEGQVRIIYSLSADARVSIRIYDYASRLVRTLVKDQPRSGAQNHGENWDGRDEDGHKVANGIYFYRLELSTSQKAFGKIVVLD